MAFLAKIPPPVHLASTANLLRVGACFHASRLSLSRGSGTPVRRASAMSTSTPPGLRTFSEGKKDGPTILFVHGWPDDHSMWNKQVLFALDR